MITKHLKPFQPISKEESEIFDFFRGLSAIVVLVSHAYQILIAPQVSSPTINNIVFHIAGCAVMVFFFLSGYMISGSLYRNASKNEFRNINLKKFFFDRLIRLYPPLLFSFLIMITVYAIAKLFNISYLTGHENYILRESFVLDSGVFGSLLFIQNIFNNYIGTPSLNASLWSLSHEFWFYVIGALFFKIVFSSSRIKYLIPLIAVLSVIFLFGRWIPFYFGLFLWVIGGCTFIIRQNVAIKLSKTFICSSILFLLASIYLFQSSNNTLYFLSKYVFGIAFTCFILYVLSKKNTTSNVSKNKDRKIFNLISDSARFSYTSYVIHWPIFMLIYGVLGDLFVYSKLLNISIFLVSIVFILVISSKTAYTLENKHKIIGLFERYGFAYEK
ncbi:MULTISPECIES: acyltransferase family protein [Vibrio]|uniref:acyltransferase family protein n=1 Tax=Vibrio TaxID=662 RepID=UPI001302979E|nr:MULTISPECIES: acyltransferase [Vibrio]WJG26990.1 acyltransferase [Vibrio furnissii]